MNKKVNIIETIRMDHGMEIDKVQGLKKMSNKQFGGDPGRAFSELIQNLIDGYPPNTPWEKRKGIIKATRYSISITDFGEGMDRERLKLIVTLGGTDKNNDPNKIGTFGMGFFAILNQRLGTKKVRIITRCENYYVELIFSVTNPDNLPEIKTKILKKEYNFSTQIKVTFNNVKSVQSCLNHANKSLKYYPCKVLINDVPFKSIWEEAKEKDDHMLENGTYKGFIRKSSYRTQITVLCKFEHIMNSSMPYFLAGRYSVRNDLRDYSEKQMPYIPKILLTINSNGLNVTISRDSFIMDSTYYNLIDVVRAELFKYMLTKSELLNDKDLILANHFVLRKKLRNYLYGTSYKRRKDAETHVIKKLAHAKVYRLNGHKNSYSLVDLKNKLSADTPLYYSVNHTNLRWLGGNFKHDFIALPDVCKKATAPWFYHSIFKEIYNDIVDLDTIKDDAKTMQKLVDRGIIKKSALSMTCSILGNRALNPDEARLVNEIDNMLMQNEIKNTIKHNLFINFSNIKTAFFDIEEAGAVIATGLFDETGRALDGMAFQNHQRNGSNLNDPDMFDDQDIILGLQRDHPFINEVIESDDPNRIYYMLTFLAHELTLCQKLLVPYSPFYHITKEKLAGGMRKAMINLLLAGKSGTDPKAGKAA